MVRQLSGFNLGIHNAATSETNIHIPPYSNGDTMTSGSSTMRACSGVYACVGGPAMSHISVGKVA